MTCNPHERFVCRVVVKDTGEFLGASPPFTVPGRSMLFALNRTVLRNEKLMMIYTGDDGHAFCMPADVPSDRQEIIAVVHELRSGLHWGVNYPPHEPRIGMGVLS